MRTTAFAIALLISGAAIAQTQTTVQTTPPDVDVDADVGIQPDGDLDVDADVDVDPGTTTTTTTDMTTGTTTSTDMSTGATTTTTGTASASGTMTTNQVAMAPASGAVVSPGNTDPEHDARGIAVISAPAAVPSGFNGVGSSAVGGPLTDPATGTTIDAADDSYPACSRTVTDNCVQSYERGAGR